MRTLLPLAAGLLAVALYANTLSHDFALDDAALIRDDPAIRSLAGAAGFFRSEYLPGIRSGYYRPLATLSYASNHALGGLDPRGYHALNVALHGLNAALVFALLWQLTRDRAVAGAAALLFAAHAVHTEAVANVAGRPDLLCTFFFLAALLAYAVGRLGLGERRGPARAGVEPRLYALSLLAYALALLSKEHALVFVGVLVLTDAVYGRGPWRRLAAPYAGYLALTALYLGARVALLPAGAALPSPTELDNPLVAVDAPLRVLNGLQVVARQAWLLLFPLHLSYDYSYGAIPVLTRLDARGAALLALAVAALAWLAWSRRRAPDLFYALGFLAVTLSIVSHVAVPSGSILAERVLYLPSVGFCLAAAWALRALTRRLPPRAGRSVFAGAVALAVALHGVRTATRNPDWSDTERLFLSALAVTPGSAKVQNNAGVVFLRAGRLEPAQRHFSEALRILPGYRNARLNLAVVQAALGRVDEAVALHEREIERTPDDPLVRLSLARILQNSGRHERAIAEFESVARLRPGSGEPVVAIGASLVALGRTGEAIRLYEEQLRRVPDDPALNNDLGYLLIDREIDVARGIRHVQRALAALPEHPDLLDSLAWGYAKQGRGDEAIALLERSLEIDPDGPSAAARRARLERIRAEIAP